MSRQKSQIGVPSGAQSATTDLDAFDPRAVALAYILHCAEAAKWVALTPSGRPSRSRTQRHCDAGETLVNTLDELQIHEADQWLGCRGIVSNCGPRLIEDLFGLMSIILSDRAADCSCWSLPFAPVLYRVDDLRWHDDRE